MEHAVRKYKLLRFPHLATCFGTASGRSAGPFPAALAIGRLSPKPNFQISGGAILCPHPVQFKLNRNLACLAMQ